MLQSDISCHAQRKRCSESQNERVGTESELGTLGTLVVELGSGFLAPGNSWQAQVLQTTVQAQQGAAICCRYVADMCQMENDHGWWRFYVKMGPVSTLAATVDQIWYDMAWYGHSMNITTWKRHLYRSCLGFWCFFCVKTAASCSFAKTAVFAAALTMRQVPRRFPGHFMPHRRLTYAAGWNDPKSRFMDLNGLEFDLNLAWTLDSLASLDSGFGHRLFPGRFRHLWRMAPWW